METSGNGKALPLIIVKDEKFILVKESLDFIRNIKTDIAVVSVAGLYRYFTLP